jgi:hypothetical protein
MLNEQCSPNIRSYWRSMLNNSVYTDIDENYLQEDFIIFIFASENKRKELITHLEQRKETYYGNKIL